MRLLPPAQDGGPSHPPETQPSGALGTLFKFLIVFEGPQGYFPSASVLFVLGDPCAYAFRAFWGLLRWAGYVYSTYSFGGGRASTRPRGTGTGPRLKEQPFWLNLPSPFPLPQAIRLSVCRRCVYVFGSVCVGVVGDLRARCGALRITLKPST